MSTIAVEPIQEFGDSYRSLILAASLVVALVIFVLDSFVPMGVAMGELYVIPVVLSLASERRLDTAVVACVGSILALAQLLLFPITYAEPWTVYWDRIIAVFVIWTAGILGFRALRARRHLKQVTSLLTICAYTKKVRVGDKWIGFDEFLSRELGLKVSHGMTEEVARRLLEDWGIEIRERRSARDAPGSGQAP